MPTTEYINCKHTNMKVNQREYEREKKKKNGLSGDPDNNYNLSQEKSFVGFSHAVCKYVFIHISKCVYIAFTL